MKQNIVNGICRWIKATVPEIHVYDFNPEQGLMKPCAIVEEPYSYVDTFIPHKEEKVFHDLSLYTIKIIAEDERETRNIMDTLRLSMNLIDCGEVTIRPYGITSNMNQSTKQRHVGFVQFYARVKYVIKSSKPYIMNKLDLYTKAKENGRT